MKNLETVRSNNQITAASILLIDENGEKLGVFNRFDAMKTAESKSLDLIEITFDSRNNQSVCKLGDYNKFVYEKKKREKEQSKIQRENAIDIKEVYLRPNTSSHDVEIKAKKTLTFLENGDRVKIMMKFRNREVTHKDVGQQTFKQFLSFFEPSMIEKPMQHEGNNILAVLFKPV